MESGAQSAEQKRGKNITKALFIAFTYRFFVFRLAIISARLHKIQLSKENNSINTLIIFAEETESQNPSISHFRQHVTE